MKNMKVAKILLTFVIVGSLIYSCKTTTEQVSSVNDSTTVQCDSVWVDSTAKACCDSVKVDSVCK
jgi:hypothetical protein